VKWIIRFKVVVLSNILVSYHVYLNLLLNDCNTAHHLVGKMIFLPCVLDNEGYTYFNLVAGIVINNCGNSGYWVWFSSKRVKMKC